MEINDDRRREVAKNLRKQLRCMRENDSYEKDVDVAECGNTAYRNIAWAVEPYGNVKKGNYVHIIELLADLIDCPTCRLCHTDTELATDGYPIRVYECSNCGRAFDNLYDEYEYCPHCGAEVVE